MPKENIYDVLEWAEKARPDLRRWLSQRRRLVDAMVTDIRRGVAEHPLIVEDDSDKNYIPFLDDDTDSTPRPCKGCPG
jgi:hypothetical protein